MYKEIRANVSKKGCTTHKREFILKSNNESTVTLTVDGKVIGNIPLDGESDTYTNLSIVDKNIVSNLMLAFITLSY